MVCLLVSVSLLTISIVILLVVRKKMNMLDLILDSLISGLNIERKIRDLSKQYSLRPKKRYIVFEVFPSGISFEKIKTSIYEVAEKVLGYKGISEARMKLIYYDEEKARGILRIRREHKYMALAVLGLIRNIDGSEVLVIPITTTGSLKRAKELAKIQ